MGDPYMELIDRLLKIVGEADDVRKFGSIIESVLKNICEDVATMTEIDEDEDIILVIKCGNRIYEAKMHVDVRTSVRFKEWRAHDYLFDEDEEE